MAAGRIGLTVNGRGLIVEVADGESLLSVLRERVGVMSVKDGCAPQGQCGCCTVLVDGEPRVACVTPAVRADGRTITTVEGLEPGVRDGLASAFVATGGSQCGFCTPGIVLRVAWLQQRGKTAPVDIDRALAAHLCRCTGWQTIVEACRTPALLDRSLAAASQRASLEGGVGQTVAPDVPFGAGGFADDSAPRDALVAVPAPPETTAEVVDAAGSRWVIGESLLDARVRAGKVQGRRTTIEARPPLAIPDAPNGGVALATSWVEPAYLETDASWCVPGGEAASPLANGGAFGGKETSLAPRAARELADLFGHTVRVVYSREDVVRLGHKRPPIAAVARYETDSAVARIRGDVVQIIEPFAADIAVAYACSLDRQWRAVASPPGPPVSAHARACGWAEQSILLEGALTEAGVERLHIVRDEYGPALLDTCVVAPSGAAAGARVTVDGATGAVDRVDITVMAGDPLDDVVLRSYCIGAVHMALGWVLSEAIAVDPETGDVRDLTIRSFGILRARHVPPITVTIIDDPRPPLPRASDAVFASTAAALWNAIASNDGVRPSVFPARMTRAARALR